MSEPTAQYPSDTASESSPAVIGGVNAADAAAGSSSGGREGADTLDGIDPVSNSFQIFFLLVGLTENVCREMLTRLLPKKQSCMLLM